jgi:hypothetical protein
MTNLIEKEILYKNDDNHLTSYFSVRHGGFEAENEVKREREREREKGRMGTDGSLHGLS